MLFFFVGICLSPYLRFLVCPETSILWWIQCFFLLQGWEWCSLQLCTSPSCNQKSFNHQFGNNVEANKWKLLWSRYYYYSTYIKMEVIEYIKWVSNYGNNEEISRHILGIFSVASEKNNWNLLSLWILYIIVKIKVKIKNWHKSINVNQLIEWKKRII